MMRNNSSRSPFGPFFFIALSTTAVWFVLGFCPHFFDISWISKDSNWGMIGDTFGGVNALFSGLALAGVIVALWYQTEELRLQREELQLQRKEMDDSQAIWLQTAEANAETAKANQSLQQTQIKQSETLLLAAYVDALRVNFELSELSQKDKSVLDVVERSKLMLSVLERKVQEICEFPDFKSKLFIAGKIRRLQVQLVEVWERSGALTLDDIISMTQKVVRDVMHEIAWIADLSKHCASDLDKPIEQLVSFSSELHFVWRHLPAHRLSNDLFFQSFHEAKDMFERLSDIADSVENAV